MPLESLLALAAKEGTFWMPPAASTVAEQVDHIYYVIYYLSLLFGIPIIVLMCYFAVKYRRKGAEPSRTHPLEGNVRLECHDIERFKEMTTRIAEDPGR